ncbi:MAG TPA: ATP synthase F1 subunit delta [Phycisphaerae bacterium]|mgnify:FL=1|jgi:F-type H+-transporting ATPase subunit delta|nr:ATP synthase F1 subunit delta [Phycisphaerae bacterium]HRS28734.1 ATP synthase F1 subunit delta [Phycisphaerae bacterium]
MTIKGSDIAKVYADALFDLAKAAGTIDKIGAELQELASFQVQEPQFAEFLSSQVIDDDERERSLERMFRGRVDDTLLDTLQVMNQHGRIGLLPQLLRAFVLRIEEDRGQVEVRAISAVELSGVEQADVQTLAAQLTGRQPLMDYRIDPSIIGGLVLEVGGYRYDDSVRHNLDALRRRMLERSSRGLKIGVT